MGEHHTEVDGLEATWRTGRRQIEIMNVYDLSRNKACEEVIFAPGTDLAAAREQRPSWSRLWDAIRHEFWAEYTPVTRAEARWWE